MRIFNFKFLVFKSSERAFTLVESMVAISILSLAVTGPLLIAQKGLGSAIYARDQITAFYLAQEAVEYVRNVRDSNRITDSADWLAHLSECRGGKSCVIDAGYSSFDHVDAVTECPPEGCPRLFLDTVKGIYGYCGASCSGWRTTPFTRTVAIDDSIDPDKEAAINVTIAWSTNLFQPLRTFTVKEYIFNFR